MELNEKQISYTTTNSYTTLNSLTEATKNVWIVLHGIGYLSRYFLKYFNELQPNENYIIAPQAPSKYYLNDQYQYVGASWLTKENTAMDIENVLNYVDGVFLSETIPDSCNLIVFGFSQGVSIATRWVAKNRILFDHLVLYAGGIPNELTSEDFAFLEEKAKITVIIGDKDEYLTEERLKSEKGKIKQLFKKKAKQLIFEGGHEVKKELINQLI